MRGSYRPVKALRNHIGARIHTAKASSSITNRYDINLRTKPSSTTWGRWVDDSWVRTNESQIANTMDCTPPLDHLMSSGDYHSRHIVNENGHNVLRGGGADTAEAARHLAPPVCNFRPSHHQSLLEK